MVNKIKSDLKVKHYFINKNNNCYFDSQMQQFNITQASTKSDFILKINRFIRSMTQGTKHRDLIKK